VIAAAPFAARLPQGVDFAQIAPILCAGVTTYKGPKEAEARPGEWVAISGIGGVGHVAIQYAKAMGLYVAALDIAPDKLALVRAAGADIAVDARSPDAVADILKATGGGAQGVLVTAVSPPSFSQALRVVRRRELSVSSVCRRAIFPPRFSTLFSSASPCAARSLERGATSMRPSHLLSRARFGLISRPRH
jgi:D-arabinose 1-dehydrogenase-like Zn-dependent alcohol dehydrogenase